MVLYARSDVVGVGVPADGGGCGIFHSRPVVNGAPVKLFAIDCPQCEAYLKERMPQQWTSNRWDIPLTHDEQQDAERLEAQARQLQQANVDTATRAAVDAIKSAKAEEDAVLEELPKPVPEPGPDPAARSEEIAREDEDVDLGSLTVVQLRTLAREVGVSQAGSKKDLIARLEAARG